MSSTKKKLSTKEAAVLLNVCPNTLDIWRHKHKGPRYYKIGARVLYDVNDLLTFFSTRAVEPAENTPKTVRSRLA